MYDIIEINNKTYSTPIALVDDFGLVVFFYNLNAGTVIQSDGTYPIGYHSPEWNMELNWQPFKGTITMNFA